MIRYKTAKLFEAATQVGAILAGAAPEAEAALADYGMHLGTAFQLIDDVLDYSGDLHETGKNLGDDLAEGKPTLPLIHVMRSGTDAERALVRHAIEGGGKADLEAVLAAIRRTGALDYAREQARAEAGARHRASRGASGFRMPRLSATIGVLFGRANVLIRSTGHRSPVGV